MEPVRRLEDVFEKVADGEPVDWDSLEAAETHEEDRGWLEAMRVLDDVANAHRALPPEGEQAPRAPAGRWGKYFLSERLGAGSFGEVYRAWDPSLQRHVAIKLLHPGLSSGDTVSDRLLEEGQRLASVRHPNIVSVLEVEQHGGRSALCMEFVRGRTLDEVVRLEGTLKAREAAHIGVAVCGALAAVHAAGLLHRDVKAHNVMREASGRIVLMDFGSGVRFAADGAVARTAVGTPFYMAPELFAGTQGTRASDVYSVGVLLYFLVSGRYPVEGATVDAVRDAHRREAVQPLEERCTGLPEAFVEAVNGALCPRPEARVQTAEALQSSLQAMLRATDRRSSGVRTAAVVAAAILGGFLTILSVGWLTSITYEFLLGIAGPFVAERWTDRFVWGLRSLVAPVVTAAGVSGVLYLSLECFALIQKMSARVQRAVRTVRTWARSRALTHQFELRDGARLAVLGSVAFLVWVPFAGFPDLVRAFITTPLAVAPDDALRVLGPPGMALQDTYRQGLSVAVTLMCAAWMTLWRAASRRGGTLGRSGWLGLGCVLATLALMQVPYRIIYHNQAERARYGDADCYVNGQSPEAILLFCPSGQPRVFSVSRTDQKLMRHGTFGGMFETIE